jgi:hypothetical protein
MRLRVGQASESFRCFFRPANRSRPFQGRGLEARSHELGEVPVRGKETSNQREDHFEVYWSGPLAPSHWVASRLAERKVHWEIACITVINAAKRLVHPFTIYSGTTTLAILHENTEAALKLMVRLRSSRARPELLSSPGSKQRTRSIWIKSLHKLPDFSITTQA